MRGLWRTFELSTSPATSAIAKNVAVTVIDAANRWVSQYTKMIASAAMNNPMPADSSAMTVQTKISDARCTSSCSSVVSSSRRVCAMPTIVVSRFATDLNSPLTGPPSPSGDACADSSLKTRTGGWSAAPEQEAEHETDAGGDADGLPGLLAHEDLRVLGERFGALERVLLDFRETILRRLHRLLGARACLLDLLARLRRRRLEQRLGVANHGLHVFDELVGGYFLGFGFGHRCFSRRAPRKAAAGLRWYAG